MDKTVSDHCLFIIMLVRLYAKQFVVLRLDRHLHLATLYLGDFRCVIFTLRLEIFIYMTRKLTKRQLQFLCQSGEANVPNLTHSQALPISFQLWKKFLLLHFFFSFFSFFLWQTTVKRIAKKSTTNCQPQWMHSNFKCFPLDNALKLLIHFMTFHWMTRDKRMFLKLFRAWCGI